MLGIEPGSAGWEERMLPLCYADPPKYFCKPLVIVRLSLLSAIGQIAFGQMACCHLLRRPPILTILATASEKPERGLCRPSCKINATSIHRCSFEYVGSSSGSASDHGSRGPGFKTSLGAGDFSISICQQQVLNRALEVMQLYWFLQKKNIALLCTYEKSA